MRAASFALFSTMILSPLTLTAQQASADILFARTTAHPSLDSWDIAQGRTTLATQIGDITLRGYLYNGKNPNAPTILLFNSESVLISQADAFYRSLAALGPTIIVYDYRGLGYSTGKPSVRLFRQDGLDLYDRVTGSIRADHPVIVYGFSMGTAIAAYIASQRPVAALVLSAPMASAADELPIYARLLGKGYENVTPSPEATNLLDEPSLVAQSQSPLLVIHSSTDFLVPVAQGNRVFAASAAPSKRFALLQSTTHGATPGSPAALKAVKQLLTTISTN